MAERRRRQAQPERKPEWQVVYDQLLASADFEDVVTYEQLSAVLGREFTKNRSPIYRAMEQLGDLRRRWLEAVPQLGYRVIEANEHVRLALSRKERGRRQFTKMLRIGRATDYARLTQDERMLWDEQHRINVQLATITMSHEQRLTRIEEILRDDFGKEIPEAEEK
jgi:hypothetical protein